MESIFIALFGIGLGVIFAVIYVTAKRVSAYFISLREALGKFEQYNEKFIAAIDNQNKCIAENQLIHKAQLNSFAMLVSEVSRLATSMDKFTTLVYTDDNKAKEGFIPYDEAVAWRTAEEKALMDGGMTLEQARAVLDQQVYDKYLANTESHEMSTMI